MSLTYRLLGSVTEAEDAVQETYLRWYSLPPARRAEISSPVAWLTTVAGRICLDRLGSAQHRRERYVGEWLPEPLPEDCRWSSQGLTGSAMDPAEQIALDESVTTAFLIVLDLMTPAERVAFILHDVFRYPFTEIAEILGRSAQASRQLAASGRRRIRSTQPAPVPADLHAEAVRTFKDAWRSGNIDALLGILDPAAVAVIDGGGLVSAEPRPVAGAGAVARFFLGIVDRQPDLAVAAAVVNGRPGLVARSGDDPLAVISLGVRDGRITNIWAVRNPHKLGGWAAQAAPPAEPAS